MRKRVSIALLIAVLILAGFSGCGDGSSDKTGVDYPPDFQAFLDSLDTDFSSKVNRTISDQGDDPVLGFRSAGSPAEKKTAAFIEKTMNEIGLKNVRQEETDVDGWTFKGANISFTDDSGKTNKIDLGGYQTTLKAKDEKIDVVYVKKGTAADYQSLDVEGKLVLIDIDQNEEFWINMPAYQAKVKGARAVLANSAMPVEMADRIGVQDMCGPADAPALGISQADTDKIKAAIKASGKDSIQVTLNADSTVTPDVKSQNVIGEIPGKTDEVIYMFAHMDGYFHSYFDDASGIGLILGTAKAMVDSNFVPDKTIRFICHGAEEWGRENSMADWSIGAYEEITNLHPEWAKDAFAIVNIDGAYCVKDEQTFGIAVCEELYNYINPLVEPMTKESSFEYSYMIPPSTFKEDFNYVANGVPSVATAKGKETVFYDKAYHTSADTTDVMGFNEEAWSWMHTLFGRIVYGFDDLAVRPMDFTTRFEALKESFDETILQDKELNSTIDKAIAAANPVAEKVNTLNKDYANALERKDSKAADSIRSTAITLNERLYNVYKETQSVLLHLDQEMSIIFPHENRQSDIVNLRGAIESLEAGKGQEALAEYLSGIGNGWNAMFFDEETVDYYNDQLGAGLEKTWADGLVDVNQCYVDDVVRSLMAKVEDKNTDFAAEIAALEELEQEQLTLYRKVVDEEKEGLTKLTNSLVELQ